MGSFGSLFLLSPRESRMNLINISTIIIPEERQRREFSPTKLWELEASIAHKGLLHPPVVRNDGVTLVAGERRMKVLRAMHEKHSVILYDGVPLSVDTIPVTLLAELSEDDLYEAELEENTLRVDLSWQEKAIAIDNLHKFRTRQNPTQTKTDTATEILGRAPSAREITSVVRNSTLLTQHLGNPEVAKAKTEKEAFKIVEKKLKADHRARLSEEFQTLESKHTLIKGDSLQVMKAMEPETYDCIITDPPYGMGADTFGTMALNAHQYDDSANWFTSNVEAIADSFFWIAKPQAHLYCFCDIQNFFLLQEALTQAGWDVWRTPLVWYKGNMGMLPKPDHGPRRTYELAVFATKGKKQVQIVGAHDVINVISEQGDRDHGAQKPPALYRELIRRSCLPGDSIIDPFCGSGPIFPAADSTETIATGIELGDDAYSQAFMRLQESE